VVTTIGALDSGHVTTLAESCLVRNAWICPDYVTSRRSELAQALGQHLVITVTSVMLGVLIALPMALLVRHSARLQFGLLALATAVYSVPSLALFSLLLPFTGLSRATVITGLVLYSLTILVRNTLTGLQAVPDEVIDAARGMGYRGTGLLWRVELPLALPTVLAGVRVATVSTVALTTVGTVVGNGGLGDLIYAGLRSDFKAQVLAATVLCVLLAVVLDLMLLALQRSLTPWQRAVSGR